MSDHTYWTRMRRRRLSRRSLLGASARAGVGAAGLALVGCGDDDDDDQAAAPAPADQVDDQAMDQAADQVADQADQADEADQAMEEEEPAAVADATPGDFEGLRVGGTITSVDFFPREPPSLDPYIETSFLAQYIGTTTMSRLLKFDTGPGITPLASIVGDAAETFESIDPDGLEWVFDLRAMNFHDKPPINGRPMDAEDVTSSFQRFIDQSPNFRIFELVDSAEAVDASTVKFTLSEPFAGFLENMASPSGLFIFSREANAGEVDPTKEDGIIGTGAWIFDSLTPAVEIEFRRNPDWYETVITPDGREVSAPFAERFVNKIQPEFATRLSLFVAGDGDFWDLDSNNRELPTVIEQAPDIQVVPDMPTWLFSGWQFNQESENGLWQDPRARIAISKAIDRDALIEAFGELSTLEDQVGISLPSGWNTLVPWGKGGEFWYLDPKSEFGQEWADNFVFDPNEARNLLDAAGYDGASVDMNYLQSTYGSIYDQFTEAQLPMLADVGLNINSQIREYALQWSSEPSREFPGLYYNYVTPFNTIDEYMQLWFSPENDDVRHPFQRKINPPEIVDLVNRQRQEFDRSARQALVHDVIRMGGAIMNVVPTVMGRWGFTQLAHPWIRHWQGHDSAGYGWLSEEVPFYWTERDNPAT